MALLNVTNLSIDIHGIRPLDGISFSFDKDKTAMIAGAIAAGTSQYGMQTFDQAIFNLYSQKLVSLDEALRWASNVDDFKLKISGVSTTTDMARDDMAAKANAPVGRGAPAPAAKPSMASVSITTSCGPPPARRNWSGNFPAPRLWTTTW